MDRSLKRERGRRLSSLKTRTASLPPLVSTHRDSAGHSITSEPWRRWYKTKRWQQLRWHILKRDQFKCQVTGVLLIGKHPAPNSPVVDHKHPHRGDERLFWDENNLHAVSKAYHDSTKQSLERKAPM